MLRQAARTVARRRVAQPRLQQWRTFLEPPPASPQQAVQATSNTSTGAQAQTQAAASPASHLTATAASSAAATEAATGAKPKAAHRKLIEKERQRAAAAFENTQAPQLLVSNVVDKGKGRAVDEAVPVSAGASGIQSDAQQTASSKANASGKEQLLEGEWLRKRQQTVAEAGSSSGSTKSSEEEGLRSFAEYASTSTPVSNSLLVTLPPSASQGQSSYSSENQQDEGSSSTSSDVGFLPFLPLRSVPIPSIRHPFNTNRFVNTLESRGEFDRSTAEEIMRATKALLTVAEEEAARDLVAKTDLENEAYLFSAALSELRTEVQMTARTDGIALRSLNAQLQREVDSLSQKMREDMNSLKNDNQLDLNNRKEEASTDINTIEQRILDLNSKFILLVGDTRAALEANKWIQTRRSIGKASFIPYLKVQRSNVLFSVALVGLAILVMAYVSLKPVPPPPPPPKPPTIEELGLKPIEELDPAAESGFFSSWLSSGAGASGSAKPAKDGPRPS